MAGPAGGARHCLQARLMISRQRITHRHRHIHAPRCPKRVSEPTKLARIWVPSRRLVRSRCRTLSIEQHRAHPVTGRRPRRGTESSTFSGIHGLPKLPHGLRMTLLPVIDTSGIGAAGSDRLKAQTQIKTPPTCAPGVAWCAMLTGTQCIKSTDRRRQKPWRIIIDR